MGCTFFIFKDRIYLSHGLFFTAVAVIFVTCFFKPLATQLAVNLLLGYVVLYLAYVPGGFVRRFNQLGDYSYGIYIYAFPLQQAVVALVPGVSVWNLTWSSYALTCSIAALSWHILEKPLLREKHRSGFITDRLRALVPPGFK